jgi:hypothetical protein
VKYLTIQQVACVALEALPERLDPLMEALLAIEQADSNIEDPDLAADLTTGEVDVQMAVEAGDPAEAMVKALATLRAAIHAIGDATPGWETGSAVMHAAPIEAADRLLTVSAP